MRWVSKHFSGYFPHPGVVSMDFFRSCHPITLKQGYYTDFCEPVLYTEPYILAGEPEIWGKILAGSVVKFPVVGELW